MTATVELPPPAVPGGAPGRSHWLRVAREVADDLAADAVTRDRARTLPAEEVGVLRESDLLRAPQPPAAGGGGTSWATACAVVREISAADASIGQLVGHHYLLSRAPGFFGAPGAHAGTERRSVAERWLWGGSLRAGADSRLSLAPAGDGLVLDGYVARVAGARVADRLVLAATRWDTGDRFAVLVSPHDPGVVCAEAPDRFGQRLSGDGAVECDGVPVTAGQVLGPLVHEDDVPGPRAAPAAPASRLVSAHVSLGMAEGALAEARDRTRAGGDVPWSPGAEPDPLPPARQPDTLGVYGELAVLARGARALTEQAVAALDEAVERGGELTEEERGEVGTLAAAAAAAAAHAALEITGRVLEAAGPPAAATRHGFDRFWRNARVHTAHDAAAARLREIGDHYLNEAPPPFALHV